jgi:hypothetical protein
MVVPQLPDIPTPFPVEETIEAPVGVDVLAPAEGTPPIAPAKKIPPQPPKRWRHRRRKKSNQSTGLNRTPHLG